MCEEKRIARNLVGEFVNLVIGTEHKPYQALGRQSYAGITTDPDSEAGHQLYLSDVADEDGNSLEPGMYPAVVFNGRFRNIILETAGSTMIGYILKAEEAEPAEFKQFFSHRLANV